MEHKKKFILQKNDRKMIVANLMKECHFHMRFSKRIASRYWQIVSFSDEHIYHRTHRNRQTEIEWLAKKFISTLRHTPGMKTNGLIVDGLKDRVLNCHVSKHTKMFFLSFKHSDFYFYYKNESYTIFFYNVNLQKKLLVYKLLFPIFYYAFFFFFLPNSTNISSQNKERRKL